MFGTMNCPLSRVRSKPRPSLRSLRVNFPGVWKYSPSTPNSTGASSSGSGSETIGTLGPSLRTLSLTCLIASAVSVFPSSIKRLNLRSNSCSLTCISGANCSSTIGGLWDKPPARPPNTPPTNAASVAWDTVSAHDNSGL